MSVQNSNTHAEHAAILVAKAGITLDDMVANIVWHHAAADGATRIAGRAWYAVARREAESIATANACGVHEVAAVIAQLSPRTQWARNVQGARDLFATGEAPGMIGANVARARKAIGAKAPLATVNGPKVSAFARNILGDQNVVTLDVWAMRVAYAGRAAYGGDDHAKVLSRVGVYAAVAHAYTVAAGIVGESPADMQAITWIVARNGRAG